MFLYYFVLSLFVINYVGSNSTPDCGKKENVVSYLNVAAEMINRAKSDMSSYENLTTIPADCTDILRMGKRKSGVYTIRPMNRVTEGTLLNVYCDMDTDGGGWTVIQRRGNYGNPTDYFFREWQSYKKGFGNIEKEFWLGNDNIFALTNQKLYSVRFDFQDAKLDKAYALYDYFWIDDERNNYTLSVEAFSGDAVSDIDKNFTNTPVDCADILRMGQRKSGVYSIRLMNRVIKDETIKVYCDMDTDGGGWTVIQRRGNYGNAEDYFFREWKSYKEGFGNIEKEFWLGDSLNIHNKQKFSTKDVDNAYNNSSYGNTYKTGWWYSSNSDSNLNGLYTIGERSSSSVYWYTWKGFSSLLSTEIKIRPRIS